MGPTPTPEMIDTPELVERVGHDRRLVVELGQYASACTILLDAVGRHGFGTPPPWRAAVEAALEPRDCDALKPFVSSRPDRLPSALCVLTHRTCVGRAALADDLERIAAIPLDEFVGQLPDDGHWEAVARQPRRWLDAFAAAIGRACDGLQSPWREAAGLLDREMERVQAAGERGATRELIAMRIPPRALRLQAPRASDELRGDAVEMVPLLTGPGATHAWFVGGDLTHVAYPVPAAARLSDVKTPAPAALDALLGTQRTAILRLLDQPHMAGELADALAAVPSAVTHHLDVLEGAGLVGRERLGRHVRVIRTARGTELLALYE